MKSNTKAGNTAASSTLDAWTQRHFDAAAVPAWLSETLRGSARGSAARKRVEPELVEPRDLLQGLKGDRAPCGACARQPGHAQVEISAASAIVQSIDRNGLGAHGSA